MLNRNSTVSDWVCRWDFFPTLCDNGVLLEEFGARSTLVYIYWHEPQTRRNFYQILGENDGLETEAAAAVLA